MRIRKMAALSLVLMVFLREGQCPYPDAASSQLSIRPLDSVVIFRASVLGQETGQGMK